MCVQDPTGALARALPRPDGVELYLREWPMTAGVAARAVLVIAHGYMWHSGYFQPLAEHLTGKGVRSDLSLMC